MKYAILVLAVLAMNAFAGYALLDNSGGSGPGEFDQDAIQYWYHEEGDSRWIVWAGVYRGTWFDTQDFDPASTGFLIDQIEVWFHNAGISHSPDYMWDTDDFYSEVWNGDDWGPTVLLAQGIVTAIHQAPCYHNFDPPLETEQNFWTIINTEMSAGQWPSIYSDQTGYGGPMGPAECHSFFSDDMIVWEPWSEPYMGASDYGDWLQTVRGEFQWWWSLNTTTWGSVKAMF